MIYEAVANMGDGRLGLGLNRKEIAMNWIKNPVALVLFSKSLENNLILSILNHLHFVPVQMEIL